MTLTLRFSNSGASLETSPSSVVHTGVKSSVGERARREQEVSLTVLPWLLIQGETYGCENKILLPTTPYDTIRGEERSSAIIEARAGPRRRSRRPTHAQFPPSHSWKLMGPMDVSASKLGATLPRRREGMLLVGVGCGDGID